MLSLTRTLTRTLALLLALAWLCGAPPARADHQPAVVIPGKRGVPVIIDGQNATGAVVIGDWGLFRPGHTGVTIIRPQPWYTVRHYQRPRVIYRKVVRRKAVVRRTAVRSRAAVHAGVPHYYPGGTMPPQLGRLESDEKDAAPPVPAESFSRSWSVQSTPSPATIFQPPYVMPPVVIDNRFRPKPKP